MRVPREEQAKTAAALRCCPKQREPADAGHDHTTQPPLRHRGASVQRRIARHRSICALRARSLNPHIGLLDRRELQLASVELSNNSRHRRLDEPRDRGAEQLAERPLRIRVASSSANPAFANTSVTFRSLSPCASKCNRLRVAHTIICDAKPSR
jgi:hypothetical protein